MGVNDAAHLGPSFIDLAVNGQFIWRLVLFTLVRPFTVEVHPPYSIDRRVAYPVLLRAPAAYPHFICSRDPRAHMTQDIVNQTFHRQDAARDSDFSPQFFRSLSHMN